MEFLPTTLDEGKRYYKNFTGFDVIFVSGDPYYDHPLSGTAVLARLLDLKGYKVGVISQPETEKEFMACGSPRHFFCITSGLLDSMLANYSPLLKKRDNVRLPERALIRYVQAIKKIYKDSITIIGGVEATIRRFTHFDYKENRLRRGILNDSKADFLLFGNAERSLLDILDWIKSGKKGPLSKIDGLAYRIKKEDIDARLLPGFEECEKDKKKFSLLTRTTYLLPDDAFVEPCGKGHIKHNRRSHPLTEEEMDKVYSLNFSRKVHPDSKDFSMVSAMVERLSASVVIGRGCWGGCNFCIIPLVQGKNIAKRSRKSIVKEVESLFIKGEKHVQDLTMPTLNMYGSYCKLYDSEEKIYSPIIEKSSIVYNKTRYCDQDCVGCRHRILSDDLLEILHEINKLEKKYLGNLELRSAIRHDIILSQKGMFKEVLRYMKRLKIAPEHISDNVLKEMNKADRKAFEDFLKEFEKINKENKEHKKLTPYIVAAHPGSTLKDMEELKEFCKKNNLDTTFTQIFTPTPGTASTSMYYTGENPLTRKKVYVPRAFSEKKKQKNILFDNDDELRDENG